MRRLKLTDISAPVPDSFVHCVNMEPLFLTEDRKLKPIDSLDSRSKCRTSDSRESATLKDGSVKQHDAHGSINRTVPNTLPTPNPNFICSLSLTPEDISGPVPESFEHVSGIKLEGTNPIIGIKLLEGHRLHNSLVSKRKMKHQKLSMVSSPFEAPFETYVKDAQWDANVNKEDGVSFGMLFVGLKTLRMISAKNG